MRYNFTCKTKDVDMQYVGETENALHIRMNGHRSDITTKKLEKPVAESFRTLSPEGLNLDD